MRRIKWVLLLVVFVLVAAACGDGDDDGGDTTSGEGGATTTAGEASPAADAEFNLQGAPTGVEGEALTGFIDAYNSDVGSTITFTGSDDFESQLRIQVDGGNPPAMAFTPQPASICEFADAGELVSLETMGFDIAEMEANHSKFWMDLGLCADGNHYGIPWFPNYKSIIFYRSSVFEAEGYEIPETYEDLLALSQTAVDDGYTPWCFGFESGGATGWPGTDWIEDILIRQSGGDAYGQWFRHEIAFNSEPVVNAFDTFGDLFFGEGFVLGGPENVAGVNFNDSPGPLFTEDPKEGCLMLKQGSFISNVFADLASDPAMIDDILTFAFPSIEGNQGAMGNGDTLIVFDGSEANVAVIRDWISPEWQCTLASASGGGIAEHGGHGVAGVERLPGHKDVDPNCYESDSAKSFAEAVTAALGANTFAFDASDLMPPEVGQGSFWTGMVDWTRGSTTQAVVDAVEASWP
jgi:alpha-glucoside transport system substrate-binding protein